MASPKHGGPTRACSRPLRAQDRCFFEGILCGALAAADAWPLGAVHQCPAGLYGRAFSSLPVRPRLVVSCAQSVQRQGGDVMDVVYRLQGIEFEWDDQKAQQNVEKHGVTFEEAAEVFLIHSINMAMQRQPLPRSNGISS